MLNFTRAITRLPAASMALGLTTVSMGVPDPDRAAHQHGDYVRVLRNLGVAVTVLPAEDDFPDSVFVEDTAVFMGEGVLVTRPGAPSRRGESDAMHKHLETLDMPLVRMSPPATLDGGDVLLCGRTFYVGLSERTNQEGFQQLATTAARFGFAAEAVSVASGLHLKSGISLVGENLLLCAPGIGMEPTFAGFQRLLIPAHEAYAANCVCVNGTVLAPEGFPETVDLLDKAGLTVQEILVDEFRKLDGGLSCLSLRF